MDIARRCNLSKGSVSRALTMSPETCPLRPQTRRRVIKVAQELGYFVNAHARALSSGRSQAIGLIYEGSLPILDSVYHQIVEAFVETIRTQDYHLGLIPMDEHGGWLDALHSRRVDACICLHNLPVEVGQVARRLGLPTILLNGRSEHATGTICPDDHQGARLATSHLLELGHRRIIMVTDMQRELPHYSIGERRDGFFERMREAGLEDSADAITGDGDTVVAYLDRATEPPTAVICYSHFEAVPLLRALQRSGRRIPQDISVVTFNDVFPVRWMNPALTTVTVPAAEIGRQGAEMVLDRVVHEPAATVDHGQVMLPEALIVRESTGPAPVGQN
jgi:DNA-binding LacI/PurR family transcriptional regulator